MDLSTTYMGLKLKNPLVPSAGPLSESIENYKRMEDAGASAVVNYSLFEEQIRHETRELHHHLEYGTDSYAESLSFFPEPEEFVLGPEQYLEHMRRAKESVAIPVIASLNGYSEGGWIEYAKLIEQTGVDALELNLYFLATDPAVAGGQLEQNYLKIVKSVRSSVSIPVAVKLSPFFSSLANMAKQIDDAGADALVLFNRFYQPDIDLELLEIKPNVILSTPMAMRLPLRWIAILHKRVAASLAATSGIHTAQDVIKMLMAGADVTMLCSALLRNGIAHLSKVLAEVERWMEENEYESVNQMKGSMSHVSVEDPAALERANYMKALHSFS
jgi:dihydroorotate dehydrogenase (fumarate)